MEVDDSEGKSEQGDGSRENRGTGGPDFLDRGDVKQARDAYSEDAGEGRANEIGHPVGSELEASG